MDEPFQIAIQPCGRAPRGASVDKVVLRGVIDAEARATLLAGLRSLSRPAVLDFAAAQRINSMGIATLLCGVRELVERGIAVSFINVSRVNLKLFKMMGMLRLGSWSETEDDAVVALLAARGGA